MYGSTIVTGMLLLCSYPEYEKICAAREFVKDDDVVDVLRKNLFVICSGKNSSKRISFLSLSTTFVTHSAMGKTRKTKVTGLIEDKKARRTTLCKRTRGLIKKVMFRAATFHCCAFSSQHELFCFTSCYFVLYRQASWRLQQARKYKSG